MCCFFHAAPDCLDFPCFDLTIFNHPLFCRRQLLGRPTLATLESTAFLALGFGAVNGQDFRTRRDPLGRFTLFLISQLVSGSRVSLTRGLAGQLEWKLQGESTGPAITLWENRIYL